MVETKPVVRGDGYGFNSYVGPLRGTMKHAGDSGVGREAGDSSRCSCSCKVGEECWRGGWGVGGVKGCGWI